MRKLAQNCSRKARQSGPDRFVQLPPGGAPSTPGSTPLPQVCRPPSCRPDYINFYEPEKVTDWDRNFNTLFVVYPTWRSLRVRRQTSAWLLAFGTDPRRHAYRIRCI